MSVIVKDDSIQRDIGDFLRFTVYSTISGFDHF